MQGLIDSLYAYNDWANEQVIALCDGLSDVQLDRSRALGFGSLRATIFHILTADIIWLERWLGMPWRPFPKDANGISLTELSQQLHEVSSRRREFIEMHRSQGWRLPVEYLDSRKTPYRHQLHDLLLHVFHHGVHHRAQALSYLKQFGRTAVAGIDFIFYRLAKGSIEQSPETVTWLRQYGLGVNEVMGPSVSWDRATIQRSFEYSDWACDKVLQAAASLEDEKLDRPFDMGTGSIRKILLHMLDVERSWVSNWTQGPSAFPNSPQSTSLSELSRHWSDLRVTRNAYLAGLENAEAQHVIEVAFGGPPMRFQIVDSAIQLTEHGTHHRAQVVNLLRQVESPIDNIDLIYAIADLSAPAT